MGVITQGDAHNCNTDTSGHRCEADLLLTCCRADRMRLHDLVSLRLELLVAACIVTDPALRPASGDIISELRAIAETLRPLVDCNGCIATPEAQAAVASLPLPVWHPAADQDAQLMQDVQVMAHEVVSLRCHRLTLQEQVERMQAADAAAEAEAEARAKHWPGDGLASARDQVIDNKALAGGCGADGIDCAAPRASHVEAVHHARNFIASACNAQGDGTEVTAAKPSAGAEERGTALDAHHGLSNITNESEDPGSGERPGGNYEAPGGEGNSADTAQISQQLQGVRASHASTRHNASCSRAVFLNDMPLASAFQHADVSCLLLHFHPGEQRLRFYKSHRAPACSHGRTYTLAVMQVLVGQVAMWSPRLRPMVRPSCWREACALRSRRARPLQTALRPRHLTRRRKAM